MKNAQSVLRFLVAAADRGERCALGTIVTVIGRSSRAIGTHMAISETGDFIGSLSGGCVEAAVVGETLRVIRQGKAELIRFGIGSPFIDVRLPCGGGIDLLIVPQPARAVVAAAERLLESRKSITLAIARTGAVALDDEAPGAVGWRGDVFLSPHQPDLRLFVVGHGAETEAMARLANAYGADVRVLTPDAGIVESMAERGIAAWRLKTPARSPYLVADRYSAVIMLFHDHDWETELLIQALGEAAFFVGAMGSRATHAVRQDALRARGVREEALMRVHDPVGLIPATRDPETLALSILSQIVTLYAAGERAAILTPRLPALEGGSRGR